MHSFFFKRANEIRTADPIFIILVEQALSKAIEKIFSFQFSIPLKN